MPARLILGICWMAVLLSSCAPASPQDALQLLHRMQKSLGGADKIASIQDFEQSVRAETWDSDGKPHGAVRKRARWIKPSILRLDQVGPDDTYVLYFNGQSGWEILPDGTMADLAGGELRFAQKYLRDFNLHLWLADRDANYIITSPQPDLLSISLKADPSSKLEITLDPVSSLPLKETSISLANPDHPMTSETRFGKWAVFGGVMFPQQILIFHEGRKLAEITVEQTKVNRGIKPEDLARKPSDLKPVMAG